jgi:hypothetical protein
MKGNDMVRKNKKFVTFYKSKGFKSLTEASVFFKVPRPTVWTWLVGKVTPNPRNMQRIYKKTAGAVPVESWYKV